MSSDTRPTGDLPEGAALARNIAARRRTARIWQYLFLTSLVFGIVALVTLVGDIANETAGITVTQNSIDPAALSDRPLETLSAAELTAIFKSKVSAGLYRRYDREQAFAQRSAENVLALVNERVVKPQTINSYPLWESLTRRAEIEAETKAKYPNATLTWRTWINGDFLRNAMSSLPTASGIGNAVIGSLLVTLLAMLIAVPIGVGGAIYLEEYAEKNRLNALIETNINNLAGVPSIIYGMLGLTVFVRVLGNITSGAAFGIGSDNGRTIISAALTMALLVLPLIIINAREAIRAVPSSLRQASYGLGATRWQTVWNHVLPNALPGILTGTILGLSRALGETAPMILIGASTYIVTFPDSIFSKFTTLPIQIYNWTQQPDPQFRNIAAAGIIVLLLVLLTLNATAIVLRNRFRRSY